MTSDPIPLTAELGERWLLAIPTNSYDRETGSNIPGREDVKVFDRFPFAEDCHEALVGFDGLRQRLHGAGIEMDEPRLYHQRLRGRQLFGREIMKRWRTITCYSIPEFE